MMAVVSDRGAEENNLISRRGSKGRLEKIT
jgi:hypothetical protein